VLDVKANAGGTLANYGKIGGRCRGTWRIRTLEALKRSPSIRLFISEEKTEENLHHKYPAGTLFFEAIAIYRGRRRWHHD
jgi:hypothetical protein